MSYKKWILYPCCACFLISAPGCSKKPKPWIEPTAPVAQAGNAAMANPGSSGGDYGNRRVLEKAAEVFRPIYFAYDQTGLSEEARRILSNIVAFMREYPDISVTIEGNCDEKGTNEYNLALGEQRALAVSVYLANLLDKGTGFKTISYGEEKPAKEGRDEESRRLNRRAEFKLEI